MRPVVLCYHAVTDGSPHALAVGPETLARQVRSLVLRRFRGATVEQVLTGRGRLLRVTFDDAFRSVERALPALERLLVPATVFTCTDYADGGRALDVPELAEDAARYPATTDWDAVRGLLERGVEVGSHTRTHPHPTRLGDAELARELLDSRTRLEDELRRPCRFLAHPYGDEDSRVHAAARAAGYETAFALAGRESPLDPFALSRVGIDREDALVMTTLKTTAAVRRPAATVLRRIGRLR